MESKPFCVPLACPVMHVGHASCWWQLSGCCSFVSHSTGPGPLAFYALRATHRCVGRKCSPAPGTQAALDARAAQTEPLALLAASDLAACPRPGRGRKLQRGSDDSDPTSAHSREREPEDQGPSTEQPWAPGGQIRMGWVSGR